MRERHTHLLAWLFGDASPFLILRHLIHCWLSTGYLSCVEDTATETQTWSSLSQSSVCGRKGQ